jgi:FkbM family methyltransferase
MKYLSWVINSIISQSGLVLTRKVNVIPSERLKKTRESLLKILEIDFVIDIGANEGQWATSILKSGFSGSILSFEPESRAFSLLKTNSSKASNWEVQNLAISDKEGMRKLNVASNDALSSSFFELLPDHKTAAPHAFFTHTELVPTRLLSSCMAEIKGSRIYLKLDTQGTEHLILFSMSNEDFCRIKVLELEASIVGTYEGGLLVEEIIAFCRLRGFRLYRIENALARSGFGQQVQVDLIFIREEDSNLTL